MVYKATVSVYDREIAVTTSERKKAVQFILLAQTKQMKMKIQVTADLATVQYTQQSTDAGSERFPKYKRIGILWRYSEYRND